MYQFLDHWFGRQRVFNLLGRRRRKFYKNLTETLKASGEGKIIPLESLAYWEKGKEFGKWIGPVRTAFEKADEHLKSSHPLFSKVPVSVVERLNQCFEDLRLSMPYCVCPKCNGEPSLKPNGCDFCNSIGMICKADYEKINPQP